MQNLSIKTWCWETHCPCPKLPLSNIPHHSISGTWAQFVWRFLLGTYLDTHEVDQQLTIGAQLCVHSVGDKWSAEAVIGGGHSHLQSCSHKPELFQDFDSIQAEWKAKEWNLAVKGNSHTDHNGLWKDAIPILLSQICHLMDLHNTIMRGGLEYADLHFHMVSSCLQDAVLAQNTPNSIRP